MKVMALLELIFNLQKNERLINFSEISEVSNIDLNDVEMLLMKAMSLKLIKGKIH